MPRKNKPFQLRKGAVPSARSSKENAVIWAGPTVGLEEMIEMQTIAYHKNCKITTAQFIGQDGTKGGTLVLQFEDNRKRKNKSGHVRKGNGIKATRL